MKKFITIVFALALLLINTEIKAQAFAAKQINFTVGVGGADYIWLGSSSQPLNPLYDGTNSPNWSYPSGQLVLNVEFAVHKYVGIGVFTGVGGTTPTYAGYSFGGTWLTVPIGVSGNFHFFQLIADKQGLSIADKLDVYAGLSVGSGALIVLPGQGASTQTFAMVYAGPHVGLNYFFTPKIGVNAQFGYGQTFAQAGLVIKVK